VWLPPIEVHLPSYSVASPVVDRLKGHAESTKLTMSQKASIFGERPSKKITGLSCGSFDHFILSEEKVEISACSLSSPRWASFAAYPAPSQLWFGQSSLPSHAQSKSRQCRQLGALDRTR